VFKEAQVKPVMLISDESDNLCKCKIYLSIYLHPVLLREEREDRLYVLSVPEMRLQDLHTLEPFNKIHDKTHE
jgi:hypothetical protein